MPRPARRSSEMKDVLTLLHLVAFQHQAVYRPAPHMAWRVTERQQQASSFNPSPFVPQLTHPTAGLLSGKTPLPAFGQVPGLKQEPVRAQEVCASLALLPAPLLLAIAGCATAMAISHCTSCSPWLPRVFRRLSADWMLNLAEVAFRKQPAG